MTKKDLRDGMIIETRGFGPYLVMDNCTIARSLDGFIKLTDQEDDLTYASDDIFTIDKVYANDTHAYGLDNIFKNPGKLLWERSIVKEMTLEEIEKELGYKVKVVGTRPNHEFEVGDTVRIREWDDMVEAFGVDSDGDIKCVHTFVTDMKYLCGIKCKIKDLDGDNVKLEFPNEIDTIGWVYSTDMIEHV